MNALKRASNIRKLSELQGERKDLLDKCGDDFGATAIGGQVQFGNEYRVHSDQVAIIAMSVNSVTNKNTQAGAYAIVWLDKERDNEFGTHNGPATGSLIFLLKAVQDVLRQSDSSKPLIIASNNHLVCNFINGETPSISKDNSHLGTHLKSIENYIKTRTAPTHSYWLNAGKTRDSRVQRFYDLAKDVASVARKLWLDKGSGFREEAVKSASPAPDRRSPSLPRNERQQSEVRLPEIPPSLSAGHGAGLSTRAIEDIDRQRAKLIQRYGMEIAVATNRGEDRIAVIGMSVEQPDASNCQLGGYGVVWLRCCP
ncbi:hypothetical protein BDB00DRAFT_387209 [Zychaea mexicana]|uniref:uncharacterized protein n=1 Tax=Zychaea mexicana TaxID=64656 RepID=UPI0022FEB6E3|nr:uncharacterized protein BDB00DRAFT_387209 [Zychaea mexicana]KAI9493158.1 hypothetical protein BDB00DRAFT_387209 [Zychaea mexicana]